MDRIKWSRPRSSEPANPFDKPTTQSDKGAFDRPLRITFHTSSLINLPLKEKRAINVLQELAHLKDIQALRINDFQTSSHIDDESTEPANEPVADRPSSADAPAVAVQLHDVLSPDIIALAVAGAAIPTTPLVVDHRRGLLFHTHIPSAYDRKHGLVDVSYGAICNPNQWHDVALGLAGHTNRGGDGEQPALYDDLLDAEAHRECRQDIFVTMSPWLLKYRRMPALKDRNILKPSETARLVGLFLRYRDNYAFSAYERGVDRVNRGLFYKTLIDVRLPRLNRYVGMCFAAEEGRGDDTGTLGFSVRARLGRALQARDAIAFQFYASQNNDTRDAILYHFECLTLLLSGALDAQAVVAYRAYNIASLSKPKLKERDAAFRNDGFQKALEIAGAKDLYKLITGQRYQDVSLLLSKMRNTIHRAQLTTIALMNGGEAQQSIVSVPQSDWTDVLNAAKRLGSAARWGLISHVNHGSPTQVSPGAFEPYTFAVALIEECFKLVKAIAEATELSGLFPSGYSIPLKPARRPKRSRWETRQREHIDVLG